MTKGEMYVLKPASVEAAECRFCDADATVRIGMLPPLVSELRVVVDLCELHREALAGLLAAVA